MGISPHSTSPTGIRHVFPRLREIRQRCAGKASNIRHPPPSPNAAPWFEGVVGIRKTRGDSSLSEAIRNHSQGNGEILPTCGQIGSMPKNAPVAEEPADTASRNGAAPRFPHLRTRPAGRESVRRIQPAGLRMGPQAREKALVCDCRRFSSRPTWVGKFGRV